MTMTVTRTTAALAGAALAILPAFNAQAGYPDWYSVGLTADFSIAVRKATHENRDAGITAGGFLNYLGQALEANPAAFKTISARTPGVAIYGFVSPSPKQETFACAVDASGKTVGAWNFEHTRGDGNLKSARLPSDCVQHISAKRDDFSSRGVQVIHYPDSTH